MENLTIDFRNVKGGYMSKAWIAEIEKQKRLKGKIRKWRSASGPFVEVKNGRLYYDGKLVTFHKYGGKGTVYSGSWKEYNAGVGYKREHINDSFIDYLKENMASFRIKGD